MFRLKSFRQPQLASLSPLSRSLKYRSASAVAYPSSSPEPKLSEEELTTINLLIPRLCLSNQLDTAIHLTATALRTCPPAKSISFTILVHSLTSEPDLSRPMALLTRLRHTESAHSHLAPITSLLMTSYINKGRPKDALKIYNWVRRPGSVCQVEPRVYGVLVNGFCRQAFVLEGLTVLKDMLEVGLVPGEGLRRRVFRCLLREARVKEAKKLDEALANAVGGEEEDIKRVLALLDQIIADWID